MAIEKRWGAISPTPFISDGTINGLITVSSTSRFKTKQEIFVKATGELTLALEIKRIISKTQLLVGPKGAKLTVFSDISAYTVAKSSTIEAPEQSRPSIPAQEHERAVYEEEPTVAKRVFIVDELGQPVDEDNPLPVLATISDNAPQNCFIYRRDYLTADVEEFQILPANTKKLFVWVYKHSANLRLSFTQNGTIDGVTANYIPIELGNSYEREGLRLIGKTLYYQTDRDNKKIIIEAWV